MQPIAVHTLDPLRDPRWSRFVQNNPHASVFHTLGWLQTLARTYGYEPIAFTTSTPTEDLRNVLLFCKVGSWLTGQRLVSMPFSDHCDPLVDNLQSLRQLSGFVANLGCREGWEYIEIRPTAAQMDYAGCFQQAKNYHLHRLDLRPSLNTLFRRFHKDCIRRKIRKAEREGLTYEVGRTGPLLEKLDYLLRLTRKRHRILPQPIEWFRNLVEFMGEGACIRIVSKAGQPVAGMLTLRHGKTVVYKYGGSDARFHNLGSVPMLFWMTIRESKGAGAEELDLGRSDIEHAGLIRFKDRLGAQRVRLAYWRFSGVTDRVLRDGSVVRWATRMIARLPDRVPTLAGDLLYRHIG